MIFPVDKGGDYEQGERGYILDKRKDKRKDRGKK